MRLIRFLFALLLLALIASPVFADVSNAKYKTTIQISNNSTAANDVWVPFTLSSSDMIIGAMLNATATDAVMHDASGNDIVFMPGVATNPWIVTEEGIGANSQEFKYLFTSGATGGKIRYFPGTGGMTVSDNSNLEPSANFTIEQKGWVDTSSGSNKNLVSKEGVFKTYVSGTQNITSAIFDDIDWHNIQSGVISNDTWVEIAYSSRYVSQIRARLYNDYDTAETLNIYELEVWDNSTATWINPSSASDWTDSSNAADNNTGTAATYYANAYSWSANLTCTLPSTLSTKARIYKSSTGGNTVIDTYDYSSTPTASVTATGISTGLRRAVTSADSTNLTIAIYDGSDVLLGSNTVALSGASIPNNDKNWVFLQNNVMPYIDYIKLTIGGTLAGSWVWNYQPYNTATFETGTGAATGTPITLNLGLNTIAVTGSGTFAVEVPYALVAIAENSTATLTGSPVWCEGGGSLDIRLGSVITVVDTGNIKVTLYPALIDQSSGIKNSALPSFRTTSSNANVSASVYAVQCLTSSTGASTSNITAGWNMFSGVPPQPAELYGGTGSSFPGGTEIQGLETANRLPAGTFMYPFAFGTAILAGVFVFALTHNSRMGRKGSLLLMIGTIMFVLVIWVYSSGGVIPGWALIPLGLIFILLLMWRNPYNPTA